jgi:hypothetical protein
LIEKNKREGRFGAYTTLKDVLVKGGALVTKKDYDDEFLANHDHLFDIRLDPAQMEPGAFGLFLAQRRPLAPLPHGLTFECKCDWKCSGADGTRGTWNVFVEYEQRKDRASEEETWELSGLSTTQALFYAFEWDYRCWAIALTRDLRAIADPVWAVKAASNAAS